MELVNATRIYDDVLIDAAKVVNSDPELTILWNSWYGNFIPSDKGYGPEICRALLSKLINSAFGVVLREVNARYMNLGTNKKAKVSLREGLKVTSNNAGGAGGGNNKALRPFSETIDGLNSVPQQQCGGDVGGTATGRGNAAGGGGGPVDEELKEMNYDDKLREFENNLFYAEDGFNEDFADEGGGDEEDDRGPDVWEEFKVEQKSGGGPTDYSAMLVD